MTAIKLEDSVEIPARGRYPFAQLKVKKGFFTKDFSLERSIRTQASKHNKNGKKFQVHVVVNKQGKKLGVRVKRLK